MRPGAKAAANHVLAAESGKEAEQTEQTRQTNMNTKGRNGLLVSSCPFLPRSFPRPHAEMGRTHTSFLLRGLGCYTLIAA
jgi:hypothetical protein